MVGDDWDRASPLHEATSDDISDVEVDSLLVQEESSRDGYEQPDEPSTAIEEKPCLILDSNSILGSQALEINPSDISSSSASLRDNSHERNDGSFRGACSEVDANSQFEDGSFEHGVSFEGIDLDLNTNFSPSSNSSFAGFRAGQSKISLASWRHYVEEGNKRYALREINRNNFRGSGWQDLDTTGTYDPSMKQTKATQPPRTRIRRPAGAGEDNGPATKRHQHKMLTYEQGRKIGSRMILRLKIPSQQGLGKFKILVEKYPSLYDPIDNELLEGQVHNEIRDSGYGGSSSPFNVEAGIRIRRKTAKTFDGKHNCLSDETEEDYGQLLGHPVARACTECYELGLGCSLVDDGLSYPCNHCQADDIDCVLIIPPERKRTCERCNYKRLKCSYYLDGGVGTTACNNCQDANVRCVAGPAKSFRIDHVLASDSGGGSGFIPTASRQCLTCSNCRKNKIWCSVRSIDHNGPCNNCLSGKLSCTFEALPRPITATKENSKKPEAPSKKDTLKQRFHQHTHNANKNYTPQRVCETRKQKKPLEKTRVRNPNYASRPVFDSKGRTIKPTIPGGKISHITTSFCHPVAFNWVPPPPLFPSPFSSQKSTSNSSFSSFPCHFCTKPGLPYALVGLGEQRVEVLEWDADPGSGYEELEGGWAERGEEASRMCGECTTARMIICICAYHEIRPIKGLDPRTFDIHAALQGILNMVIGDDKRNHEGRKSTEKDIEEVKWCSICVMPAFYECCVRPPVNKFGLETLPSEDIGCGLLLCEVCAMRMKGMNQAPRTPHLRPKDTVVTWGESFKPRMTLDDHIAAAAKDTFHYPDGLRADACFLASCGELMRRLGMGDDINANVDGEDVKQEEEEEEEQDEPIRLKRGCWGMGEFVDLTSTAGRGWV